MRKRISRREFIATVGAGAAMPALAGRSLEAGSARRPNILFIITDQQHAGMLGCAGNRFVRTPNMDALAATGSRFERAYCGNPVCVPSRFSMLSGQMPSAIGMETNAEEKNPISPEILRGAMGRVFRDAGYRTVYGGKTHVPSFSRAGRVADYGFDEVLTPDPREELAKKCGEFLRQKHVKPFLLTASFINPHDICYMAINAFARANGQESGPRGPHQQCLAEALKLPAGVSEEEFFAKHCPPLPTNYEIPKAELAGFAQGMKTFRGYVREHWTDRDWRLHRWAYARLTERVDREIGQVLEALREAGLEDNTLIMFVSDHGDMDSSHRLEHKSVLYEEATNVPLIVSWKGVTRPGHVDREHLVSTGLDLIPTMCDFAGVAAPSVLKGRSARALAEGRPVERWRECLVVENHNARLLHMGRWKYMVGREGAPREMLVDLASDPGEMNNRAADPSCKPQLETGRRLLREWYAETGFPLDKKYII